jgi:hypothetical protein
LTVEEQRELGGLADFVASSDLCSLLFPAFIESYQQDTGKEPGGAVRYIAQRIDAFNRKGLHFRPAIVALVLREFAKFNS